MTTLTSTDTESDSLAVHHSAGGTPAYVWGYNARAGLGLGHVAQVTTPVPIRLPSNTVQVQGGLNFTVALTARGAVYAWGGNQYGQLGNGATELRWQPTRVQLPKNVKVAQIAVGTDHVLACSSSGEVWAWGHNHRGQVGNGSTTDQLVPVRVVGVDTQVATVAAGNGLSVVITRAGHVFTWGRNSFGQLGQRKRGHGPSEIVKTPAQTRPARAHLPSGAVPVAVAAGQRHVTVALRDRRLVLFGLNAAGHPSNGTIDLKPSWGRPVQVCAGEDFTLILTSRHMLLALGGNASGQLGVGDQLSRPTPEVVRIPHLKGRVVGIVAAARGAAAVTSGHEVYTWGDGNVGQHGDGPAHDALAIKPVPRPVKALVGAHITGLWGGDHHIIVITARGPAVGLRVRPQRTTVAPGKTVSYHVHRVDAFGHDLGTAGQVALTVSDGKANGRTVSAHTPGVHHVTARSGSLVGTSTLIVKNGHH